MGQGHLERAPFPWYFRAALGLGERLEASGWTLAGLDPDRLCDLARRRTGLDNFGDDYFREGLEVVLRSGREDGTLNLFGRLGLRLTALTYLANRLLLTEALERRPEVFRQPLEPPPLIILGMPRSGTTYLHRLLSADPAHRAIPLWKMRRPLAPVRGRDRRRRRMQQDLTALRLIPELDRKHAVRADNPEECIELLGTTFHSPIFGASFPVESYVRWYARQPRSKPYGEYRQLLQWLQAEAPGRRLVMKSPGHMGSLEEIRELLPGALLVQTHRDPVTVTASLSSLIYTVHRLSSSVDDPPRTARLILEVLETEVERNLAARSQGDGVLDVDYQDLVEQPLQTVETIYRHFGLPWSEVARAAVAETVRGFPANRHGRHRYALEEFQLSRDDIERRFARYRRRFLLTSPEPTS